MRELRSTNLTKEQHDIERAAALYYGRDCDMLPSYISGYLLLLDTEFCFGRSECPREKTIFGNRVVCDNVCDMDKLRADVRSFFYKDLYYIKNSISIDQVTGDRVYYRFAVDDLLRLAYLARLRYVRHGLVGNKELSGFYMSINNKVHEVASEVLSPDDLSNFLRADAHLGMYDIDAVKDKAVMYFFGLSTDPAAFPREHHKTYSEYIQAVIANQEVPQSLNLEDCFRENFV